jgi:hypothetical protein
VIVAVLAAGLLLLLPAALGGHPSRLARIQLRRPGWVALALGTQVVMLAVSGPAPNWVPAVLHVTSYAFAACFVLANLALPGVGVIGAGALLNGVTIAVNGGTLPARPEALRLAGLNHTGDGFANSAALDHPRLWFLGDVFAIPAGVPLANVFSLGDLLILVGVAIAAIGICGTRWENPRITVSTA